MLPRVLQYSHSEFMGSTLLNIFLLIGSLGLGIGVTYFATSLIPDIDQQTQIIIAIVLTVFSFIALYFMSKGRGG